MPRKPAKESYSGKIAKRRVRRAKLRIVFLACIPVFLLVGFVMLMRLDALQVKNVAVEGAESVRKEDVASRAEKELRGKYFFVIPKTNMFFVDNKQMASIIETQFGRVQKAQVETGVGGDLKIKIEERKPEAIWCDVDSSCYLMSRDGLVYALAAREEMDGKIIFKGHASKQASSTLLKFDYADELPRYFDGVNVLKEKGFVVSTVMISSPDKGTLIMEGAKIIFDPSEKKLNEALQNAILVITNARVDKPDTTFDYIDVRFGTKVYYKTN